MTHSQGGFLWGSHCTWYFTSPTSLSVTARPPGILSQGGIDPLAEGSLVLLDRNLGQERSCGNTGPEEPLFLTV